MQSRWWHNGGSWALPLDGSPAVASGGIAWIQRSRLISSSAMLPRRSGVQARTPDSGAWWLPARSSANVDGGEV